MLLDESWPYTTTRQGGKWIEVSCYPCFSVSWIDLTVCCPFFVFFFFWHCILFSGARKKKSVECFAFARGSLPHSFDFVRLCVSVDLGWALVIEDATRLGRAFLSVLALRLSSVSFFLGVSPTCGSAGRLFVRSFGLLVYDMSFDNSFQAIRGAGLDGRGKFVFTNGRRLHVSWSLDTQKT